jgi:hypothetical protein
MIALARFPGRLLPCLFGFSLAMNVQADPVISEFMADNSATLSDEDGDSSDWIEIYNPDTTAVDLAGWSLTDDATLPAKWVFPSVSIPSKERLLVFASGKNRVDPAGELHTSFSLEKNGEYLALLNPDGATITTEFSPAFPPQFEDISYGISAPSTSVTLCEFGSPARARIPDVSHGSDTTWRDSPFDDSSWLPGGLGVGYENSPGGTYDYTAEVGLNVIAMRNNTTSCQIRVPLADTPDPADILSLSLVMHYDDGFALFLNGQFVESALSPDPATLTWNSDAADSASDASALEGQSFDLTSHIDKLQAGTGNVLAIHGLNVSSGSSDFLQLPILSATVTNPVGTPQEGFFSTATPGEVNGSSTFSGFLPDTKFAVGRGFYETSFNETITCAEPGATIIYTTDGTVPTLANGTQAPAPDSLTSPTAVVPINKTTALRAAAFKPGFAPTNTDTQTYLFTADIVTQTHSQTLAKGFPSSWDGVSPNYGVDPDVVGPGDLFGGQYAATIQDGLKAIPTVSIVMPLNDLFGSRGIYAHAGNRGSSWERATSAELIHPDGEPGFQIECGIRIQGATSRSHGFTKKNSFRLLFKKQYGATKLKYDLYGNGAADEFDTLVLRMHFNDGWHWSDAQGSSLYAREDYTHRLQLATGNPSSHGLFTHLYINGCYWGLYNLRERPDSGFAASYFKIDKNDWDGLNTGSPINASGEPGRASRASGAGNTLVSRCQAVDNAGSRSARHAAYQDVMGLNPDGTNNPDRECYLDVDNYIDYLIANQYVSNADWPGRNWYSGRHNHSDSEGFKFFMWDGEMCMLLSQNPPDARSTKVTDNRVGSGGGVATPGQHLRDSEAFRIRYADRAHSLLFNGGLLYVDPANPNWDLEHPERNRPAALFQPIVDEIFSPMIGESARWGDQHRSLPYTVGAEWRSERNNVYNNWFPQRSAIYLQQLKSANLYPATIAPSFNQHGGAIAAGFQLLMTSGPGDSQAGTIYYTTDGVDPLQINNDGTFSVSPSVQSYNRGGSGLPLNSSVTVMARTLNGQDWSALNVADFVVGTLPDESSLVISEFSYHPQGPTAGEFSAGFNDQDDFEYIELLNIGSSPLDLTDLEFDLGVFFDFSTVANPVDRTLPPGGRVHLVENLAAFAFRHGPAPKVLGQYIGQLDNDGELVRLRIKGGAGLHQFTYNDQFPWPTCADGDGYSLTLVAPQTSPAHDDPYSWRCSAFPLGSPGGTDAVAFSGDAFSDSDLDGLLALLEYFFGSSDSNPSSGTDRYRLSMVEITEGVDAGSYPALTYTRDLAADDADLEVQHSTDLQIWQNLDDGAVVLHSETPNGDGTSTVVWRSTIQLGTVPRQFLRLFSRLR